MLIRQLEAFVFDAIHDQAQPAQVLAGIGAALRSDGVFLKVDIAAFSDVHENQDAPLGPLLYTIPCIHCMTVSLGRDGAGPGAVWGEQRARQMLAEAGFVRVEVKQVEGDLFNNHYIAVKGESSTAVSRPVRGPTAMLRKSAHFCWNCDRETDETIVVTLRGPSGRGIALALCRACYVSDYALLAKGAPEPEIEPPGDGDVFRE